MTLLVVYLLLAIGVSFLCSILEAVLLSVAPGFVVTQVEKYPRRGKVLQDVKTDLDRSLSSILILNTFAHTMGAAGVGAQAVKLFGEKWEGAIAFLLTLAILYLSEIIPKTLGATFWKQLALPSAVIIGLLVKLLFPFVWLSAQVTKLFSKGDRGAISREELTAMARLGARHGSLRNQESELLQNILNLRGTRTEDILTPRTVVTALPEDISILEGLDRLSDRPFNRIPVFRSNVDSISGVVYRPTMLEAVREGQGEVKLSDIAAPEYRVSEELPVLQLLDLFLKRKEHLFLVEDEYGQTAGIVTLEDAVETLLGREIMDESDKVEDMQQLARTAYRQRLRDQGTDQAE
jgi:magnesium and cobalt exporter, CNNM family